MFKVVNISDEFYSIVDEITLIEMFLNGRRDFIRIDIDILVTTTTTTDNDRKASLIEMAVVVMLSFRP